MGMHKLAQSLAKLVYCAYSENLTVGGGGWFDSRGSRLTIWNQT